MIQGEDERLKDCTRSIGTKLGTTPR